jgi:hypothetical protein
MKLQNLLLGCLLLSLGACAEKPAEEAAAVVQPAPASEPVAIPRTTSAAGARVFFITPGDGATVSNPIAVEFGIDGMDVAKAGDNQPNSGHHHLLIDTDIPTLGLPVPADENHLHFGDGRTVTEIGLPVGEHTLQMLLGDYLHIPHEPPLLSEVITITVE